METMKYLALILLMLCGFGKAFAADGGDTIIDPELMNKGVWAEPYFRGPNEPARETASDEAAKVAAGEKTPEQYLDVLQKIPSSDPAVSRTWLEHKAMNED